MPGVKIASMYCAEQGMPGSTGSGPISTIRRPPDRRATGHIDREKPHLAQRLDDASSRPFRGLCLSGCGVGIQVPKDSALGQRAQFGVDGYPAAILTSPFGDGPAYLRRRFVIRDERQCKECGDTQ
jgi:hypothetical protein